MPGESRREGSPASRAIGLTAGPLGLVGALAAPRLSALPDGLRLGLGWLGVAAGLVLVCSILFTRKPASRWSLPGATALLCLGLAMLLAPFIAAMPGPARATFAAATLMAVWWISVAIPIPATSLLPLVLFPVLGVLPSGATAGAYANSTIFLFMGGFILALGIQRWGLHRRIALQVVRAIGTNPSRMVLGFMVATAVLSMWISNTATALMMLPIALAVAASMREVGDDGGPDGFAPALLLGVAYSASIGGLATPIGTPPNISFLRILEIFFPAAPDLSFGRWLLAFLPLVAILLPIAWLLLTRVAHKLPHTSQGAGREVIREEIRRMGPMTPAERRMLLVFATTAILWVSRGDLTLGGLVVPGWAGLLERFVGEPFAAANLHDATVAMTMAILTFLLPGDPDDRGRRRPLMNWETAVRLPWGILLLFGGGFALAAAFKESGLARYLGESFAGRVEGLPPILLVASTCLLLTFLTEVTSNTATTEVMLPVLIGAAGAMSLNPLLLMLPATLSASCAFMLPIATPPNAIVFGSGELEMRHMVRAGLVLNLVGVVVITAVFLLVSAPLLGVDLGSIPTWAR